VTSPLVRRATPAVVALLLLAACAPAGGGSSSTASATASSASSAAAGGPALSVAQTSAGPALTANGGLTLYEFAKDTGSTSACTGTCATNWPPLTVAAGEAASAGPGADTAMLGTITRPDGSTQVTYNGHPLYFFAGDSAAGDINGQGLNGVWFIAAPDGSMATGSPEATATPATSGGYGY
jgi:predicted lipoprotein with Yx(FWY)xxD motif